MKKEIILNIKINTETDEFENIITFKGFDDDKVIQNIKDLIGFLEIIKQQEVNKIILDAQQKKKDVALPLGRHLETRN